MFRKWSRGNAILTRREKEATTHKLRGNNNQGLVFQIHCQQCSRQTFIPLMARFSSMIKKIYKNFKQLT
ncbi:unnamed protein product [Hermetia illucens]|uniref:Uncharacterized protein n=1 Tax=Hermetia illucens TaxID=343691 RepID=A0A7R8UC21_HERIL|nr:unnamed protein product [Hermetia illucens]